MLNKSIHFFSKKNRADCKVLNDSVPKNIEILCLFEVYLCICML